AQSPPALGSGLSLSFDGVDDYVEILDAVNPTAYTLSAWIKLDTVRPCSIIVRTGGGGPSFEWSHQLRINSGNVFEHYTYGSLGEQHLLGTTVPVAGQWYHVCGVAAEGGMMRLYVNGLEQGTAQSVVSLWPGGNRWQLGTSSGQIQFFFDGLMDDVAIFPVALSPAQVTALATGATPLGGGGPYSALITTDLRARLYQINGSAYLRLPFNVAPGAFYDQLSMNIQYDDGFIAFLNGTEVARRNAPASPTWNSVATAEH